MMKRIILSILLASTIWSATANATIVDSIGVWRYGNNGYTERYITIGQQIFMKFKTGSFSGTATSDSVRISGRTDATPGIAYLQVAVYPLAANDSSSTPASQGVIDSSEIISIVSTSDASYDVSMYHGTYQPNTWYAVSVVYKQATSAVSCHLTADTLPATDRVRMMTHYYLWTDATPTVLDVTAPSAGSIGDIGPQVFVPPGRTDTVYSAFCIKIRLSQGGGGGSAPSTPTLSSPADAATGQSVTPTLTWNTAAGASTYHVQVSTVSNFASTVVDQAGIGTTNYDVSSALNYSTLYYWRVLATNSYGSSSYSTARSFTTQAAPAQTGNRAMFKH